MAAFPCVKNIVKINWGHLPQDTKKGLTTSPASPCFIFWSWRRDLNPQPADRKLKEK